MAVARVKRRERPGLRTSDRAVAALRELSLELPARRELPVGTRPVRFVIQAKRDCTSTELRAVLRPHLGPRLRVEPHFEDVPPPGEDRFLLRRFFLATIPNVAEGELSENPFDVVYRVRAKETLVARAWPDEQHSLYMGASSSGKPDPWCLATRKIRDRGWAPRMIRAEAAWQTLAAAGKGRGKGVKIGLLDTGWLPNDELEEDQFVLDDAYDYVRGTGDTQARDPVPGGPFRQSGHGTKVASVLASRGELTDPPAGDENGGTTGPGGARSPNERVTGVAPDASILPIRVAPTVVTLAEADVGRAIRRAMCAGCDVITISMGGLPPPNVLAAVADAIAAGVIITAAAGNCVPFVVAPASFAGVVGVGGCTPAGRWWWGSSEGPNVTIAAPADSVWVAAHRNDEGETPTGPLSGTSFATPCVAGAAALWIEHHGREELCDRYPGPDRPAAFVDLLERTAQNPSSETWDTERHGAGVLDVDALLQHDLPPVAPVTIEEWLAFVEEMLRQARGNLAFAAVQALFPDLSAEELTRRLAAMLGVPADRVMAELDRVGEEVVQLLMEHRDVHAIFRQRALDSVEAGRQAADAAVQRTSETLGAALRWAADQLG